MRKLLSTLMVMMTMLTVQANNKSYTYLTFETTDGAKASLEMASLKLTFIGTTLMTTLTAKCENHEAIRVTADCLFCRTFAVEINRLRRCLRSA
jgi:protein subunit release factor B